MERDATGRGCCVPESLWMSSIPATINAAMMGNITATAKTVNVTPSNLNGRRFIMSSV